MRHIKGIAVLVGILVFFIIFTPSVQAQSGDMFAVGTDSLEMKADPEQDSDTIGHLVRGNKVTIFEEKRGWGQTYFQGEKVWVALHYLIPVEKQGEEKEKDEEKQSANLVTFIDETGEEFTISTEWKNEKNSGLLISSTEITSHQIGETLSDYHFIIDAGHGGKDAGAIGLNGVNEKDLNLSTAHTIAEKLENEGATVSLTRKDDSYISLDKRVHMSNTSNANVFISIHYNANKDSTAKGLSTYYSSDIAEDLAQIVQSSIHDKVNLTDRGAKQNGYHVLRHNNKLGILLELGFVTNASDLEVIQAAGYEEKVADGLIEGLDEYFSD